METIDLIITKRIAKILLDTAPPNCINILMKSNLNAEGDDAEFFYNYVKIDGTTGWFVPENGIIDNEIHELLLQHRNFFVSQGHPMWAACILTIDVGRGNVSMDLQYD